MDNKIYILMDDSGKLNSNENSCIYGGLFFYSNKDYINFINLIIFNIFFHLSFYNFLNVSLA